MRGGLARIGIGDYICIVLVVIVNLLIRLMRTYLCSFAKVDSRLNMLVRSVRRKHRALSWTPITVRIINMITERQEQLENGIEVLKHAEEWINKTYALPNYRAMDLMRRIRERLELAYDNPHCEFCQAVISCNRTCCPFHYQEQV